MSKSFTTFVEHDRAYRIWSRSLSDQLKDFIAIPHHWDDTEARFEKPAQQIRRGDMLSFFSGHAGLVIDIQNEVILHIQPARARQDLGSGCGVCHIVHIDLVKPEVMSIQPCRLKLIEEC